MKSQQRFTPSVTEMAQRRRFPIYVLLDNIRSLYNIGAMFRTSDAALVQKVFLTGISGRPPHKEIDKVALGASDVVPWEYCLKGGQVVDSLKRQGVFIVGLEQREESVSYTSLQYAFPLCLVVGNEVEGMSEEILAQCDALIDIPMWGRATSLNVATAYGIALFEILKQYRSAHA